MTIHKPHLEFAPVDLTQGWEKLHGYPDGIRQKVLAGVLDERARKGSRTRLLRFEPGVYTTQPFVHAYWEEVFLVSGDLFVGSDEIGNGGERFAPYTYACRPPGALHGPFRSEGGCILFELHYFDESAPWSGSR